MLAESDYVKLKLRSKRIKFNNVKLSVTDNIITVYLKLFDFIISIFKFKIVVKETIKEHHLLVKFKPIF